MDQVKQLKKYQVLNSNVIKYIAIIAMTIDHLTWALFPGFNFNPIAIVGHIIGRLTMPIMCYSMVEEYIHTKSFKKYLSRLLIFAFISQIPFRLNSFVVPFKGWRSFVPFMDGSVFNQFNVLFGLAGNLVSIKIFDNEKFK